MKIALGAVKEVRIEQQTRLAGLYSIYVVEHNSPKQTGHSEDPHPIFLASGIDVLAPHRTVFGKRNGKPVVGIVFNKPALYFIDNKTHIGKFTLP